MVYCNFLITLIRKHYSMGNFKVFIGQTSKYKAAYTNKYEAGVMKRGSDRISLPSQSVYHSVLTYHHHPHKGTKAPIITSHLVGKYVHRPLIFQFIIIFIFLVITHFTFKSFYKWSFMLFINLKDSALPLHVCRQRGYVEQYTMWINFKQFTNV